MGCADAAGGTLCVGLRAVALPSGVCALEEACSTYPWWGGALRVGCGAVALPSRDGARVGLILPIRGDRRAFQPLTHPGGVQRTNFSIDFKNTRNHMGQKKKQRREQRKVKIKPDEVFSAGPLTMARFGRVVQTQTRWDPAAFEQMRKKMPEMRQKLTSDMAEQINECSGIVSACDPLPLLFSIFLKNNLVDVELRHPLI